MSGTLLSDLDTGGNTNSNDGDLVQKILNEMNSGGAAPAQVANPNTTIQHSIDAAPPTAHMIGGEHPTNADFAAMIYGGRQQQGQQQQGQQQQGQQQQFQQQPQQQQPYPYMHSSQNMWNPPSPPPPIVSSGKSWTTGVFSELKTPILVSILFFVFSLPLVSVLFSHYLPGLVKATGELTTVGLLLKSLLAGFFFWILHRVIAPLLIG